LDGYGCQLVTKHYFKNVSFFNSNYGREIEERFSEIIEEMEERKAHKNIILITDLNLSVQQCEELELALQNACVEARLLLLDHHKSGEDSYEGFPWYFLDDSRCATKITYDFFAPLYGENEKLSKLVEVVNAVDIWLSDDPHFELGKVALGMVANAREINRIMFAKANNDYLLSLLEGTKDYFDKTSPHIALEDAIHRLKKEYFRNNKPNDTLSNLVSSHMVGLLTRYKDRMSVDYKGYKGIVTYNVGNVSVVGNDFLVANPDFDFFMDVTSRKTVSFRSNGKVDVSKIAKTLANGGGHPNASGGMLTQFKDSFVYDRILSQVKELTKKEERQNGY
ncbi:MAG: 3'-to-5' oligoribonuclease B, partial [Campylobacteraceae bacterium]|nr:3'-to-5' oligoribonuclease B [Campylobacteraceae bacterium]